MQQGCTELGNVIQHDKLWTIFPSFLNTAIELPEAETGASAVVTEALIAQLRDRHGIVCYLGGTSYGFVHRTFLEYYVAKAIAEQWRRRVLDGASLTALFTVRAADPSWHEVLCLVSGMLPSEFIAPALEVLAKANPMLGAQCVQQLDTRADASVGVEAVRHALTCMVLSPSSNADSLSRRDLVVPIQLLAETWPDAESKHVLFRVAASNSPGADAAIHEISTRWPDDDARALLVKLVKSVGTCSDAVVNALASKWPDDATRDTLKEVALLESPSCASVIFCLADKWRDDETRSFLVSLAVSSTVPASSFAAQAIATCWPDDGTRAVLAGIVQSGAAASEVAIRCLADKGTDAALGSSYGSC
jgi:hypothetical protein